MTASLSHCVVYTLLLSALTAFDENTLTRNTEEMQASMLTPLIIFFENTLTKNQSLQHRQSSLNIFSQNSEEIEDLT